jgi:chromosome segregation ATPase
MSETQERSDGERELAAIQDAVGEDGLMDLNVAGFIAVRFEEYDGLKAQRDRARAERDRLAGELDELRQLARSGKPFPAEFLYPDPDHVED